MEAPRPNEIPPADGVHSALIPDDVAGESLESVLRERRLDVPTCLRLGSELARWLDDLHSKHLIHRDLRPANVVLDTRHELRLLRVNGDLSGTDATARPSGDLPRDWAYASPEQTGRLNRVLDYRTDFYSLGIVLYRMLTGQLPFAAGDPVEWTHCHIACSPPAPQSIAPEVPRIVADIVLRLLAKLPEDRYQSAHGLRADLDRCLAQWQTTGRIEPFPLGMDDVSERFLIPHKLYGRDQELATLLDAFDRMATGGVPALVSVAGYSGIGKSALVHELQRPIVRANGYFIAGKFDQHQRDIPYATVTQAFRTLVQQLLTESEERIADWRQRIAEAVGSNGQLIVDVLPQVELIIGKQAPVPPLPPTEAQHRFRMVFRQFIAVFTSQAHPLVLFLDDLQGVDAASLTLIEHVLTHPDTRYLLLIGAYRENEVGTAHPLNTSLDAIRAQGTTVIDIRLAPLSMHHLNQLVADALHAPTEACAPLTRLVWERTDGNPFFFTQFLHALHQEGLLRLDTQQRVWQWDLAQIQARDFADNVVDLIVGKLRQLPADTQVVLQLAACLGNKFHLRHLALVSGHADIELLLAPALRESLIVCADGSGKFLHDRIQQATYSVIPETHRVEIHLRIGRTLLANLTADETNAYLFDIANHFNRGAALLDGHDEQVRVAEIDLRAGRRAKTSAAYASACVYLEAGMALLDDTDWERRYALTFSLWRERAECEFLRSEFAEAERCMAVLLQRAASKFDLAAVYHQKVLLHIVKSENQQAVVGALTCLRLFGIDLPAHPPREQVQAEYETVWRNLSGLPIESLLDNPLMTEPELLAAMQVLSSLLDPAYFTDSHLYCLHLCRMVNLSLQHGMSGPAAHAFAWFGFILGPYFHRYQEGYRFTRLACDLVEKHGFLAEKARIYFAMGFVAQWTHPIATAIDFNQAAFRAATETGNLTYACYSKCHAITGFLVRSDPLNAVWREAEQSLSFIRSARFRDAMDIVVIQRRFIAAMQGRTASLSSFNDTKCDGDAFDETAFETQLTEDRMNWMVGSYWILKLQAHFLAGDYAAALAAADKAKALLWGAIGDIQTLDYFYYSALTVAALYGSASTGKQTGWRELLAAHADQLREWADNCPQTFAGKHALVSATIASIEGRDADAMRLFERAVESAREHGFVKDEGVAHELAAGFYLDRGAMAAARVHLEEARVCFARWGADGKVRQIDERYPQLRAASVSRSAIVLSNVAQIDVLSVAKASEAISGEIELNKLIETLMRVVLENAGAQCGSLLLIRNDSLIPAADAWVDQQAVHVQLQRESASPEQHLPGAIVNYVRRSREPVLLDDAAQPNPFSGDEYFVHCRPKSVLCLPILRQGELIGLLYLEHNLLTHAFTPNRMAVLELLASQAAISLENALLYADLRGREARIRRLVESNLIGVLFWKLPSAIVDANDAFLHMVGYTREEMVSGTFQWREQTPPQYQAADAHAIEQVERTGSCIPYEKEFIRKDGSRVPVLIGGALFEGSRESGVSYVLDLTERKRADEQIRYMTHYDALTGLPNRELMQDRIRQAIAYARRNDTQLAVLFIDLDYFKHINVSLGSKIGDRLLQMAATRLQQSLREGDSVSRTGGDEYALCIPLLNGIGEAALVAQKVLNALGQAFLIDGHELHATASIGISLYPEDGADVDTLMGAAYTAMIHAKERGRGNYEFFTQALNKAAQQRLTLENQLRQAFANNEFVLHYQPQVDMANGVIVSSEALLRWRQPGKMPISCAAFIAVAEETSLILPIGEWVLREACRQLKQWQEAGHPELRVAVNLSPQQFYQPHLIDMIVAILNETGLPASSLDLEITEGILLQHSEPVVDTLTRISNIGIQLSLDDFGTGYSSLAYLQRFPVHKLKIDQSFVRNIGHDQNATALVSAIIAMANSLHMNVLAEGVETLQQIDFLTSHGCPFAQGFYYSEAVPADAFTKLLGDDAPPPLALNHRSPL